MGPFAVLASNTWELAAASGRRALGVPYVAMGVSSGPVGPIRSQFLVNLYLMGAPYSEECAGFFNCVHVDMWYWPHAAQVRVWRPKGHYLEYKRDLGGLATASSTQAAVCVRGW